MAERGMKKFLPFSSLTEQANFINEMIYEKNKIPKPQISNEQAEKINRILLQNLKDNLHIKFYLEGYLYFYDGKIDFIDKNKKVIYINDYIIPIKNIIDIDVPNVLDEIC